MEGRKGTWRPLRTLCGLPEQHSLIYVVVVSMLIVVPVAV
jgi:hypothetical protein